MGVRTAATASRAVALCPSTRLAEAVPAPVDPQGHGWGTQHLAVTSWVWMIKVFKDYHYFLPNSHWTALLPWSASKESQECHEHSYMLGKVLTNLFLGSIFIINCFLCCQYKQFLILPAISLSLQLCCYNCSAAVLQIWLPKCFSVQNNPKVQWFHLLLI